MAGSYDIDRLRLAANVHAEHPFAAGRDPVDVLLMAGASYRALDELRFGVEYVGQDLEEAFESTGPDGGGRNFVGPTIAIDLLEDQLQLVAGGAVGLDRRSAPLMGSVTALATF